MRAERWLVGVALMLALPPCGLGVTHARSRIGGILEEFHHQHEKILVAAHRGAHQRYPENSLPAIEEAIRLRAHIVELDVRLTVDGHLVLMHDDTVDRTTTGTGKVSRLTLRELKALRLRSMDGAVTEYRVPTLNQALRAARDRIMVDIDLKVFSLVSLLRVIEDVGTARQVLVSSSSSLVLSIVQWLNQEVIVMPRARNAADVERLLWWLNPSIIQIDESFYTREVVERMRRTRKRIWINTLGASDGRARQGDLAGGYRRIASGGANVLQTDQPELLLRYLAGGRGVGSASSGCGRDRREPRAALPAGPLARDRLGWTAASGPGCERGPRQKRNCTSAATSQAPPAASGKAAPGTK